MSRDRFIEVARIAFGMCGVGNGWLEYFDEPPEDIRDVMLEHSGLISAISATAAFAQRKMVVDEDTIDAAIMGVLAGIRIGKEFVGQEGRAGSDIMRQVDDLLSGKGEE